MKTKFTEYNLAEKLTLYRRIKTRRALIRALRAKWYNHEDDGRIAKNMNLQHAAYVSLKALYERMPGYHTGELVEIKKWLSSHKGYDSCFWGPAQMKDESSGRRRERRESATSY